MIICCLEGRGNTPNTSTMESIFFSRARLALIFLPLFMGPRPALGSGKATLTPELPGRGQDLGIIIVMSHEARTHVSHVTSGVNM